mmetsp:Transcript_53965/g.152069  ORF Transcript_53965/g.152069 Transcript_53965/m.152069 type:complete len:202 (-) Transcript_53965:336-941(-)
MRYADTRAKSGDGGISIRSQDRNCRRFRRGVRGVGRLRPWRRLHGHAVAAGHDSLLMLARRARRCPRRGLPGHGHRREPAPRTHPELGDEPLRLREHAHLRRGEDARQAWASPTRRALGPLRVPPHSDPPSDDRPHEAHIPRRQHVRGNATHVQPRRHAHVLRADRAAWGMDRQRHDVCVAALVRAPAGVLPELPAAAPGC